MIAILSAIVGLLVAACFDAVVVYGGNGYAMPTIKLRRQAALSAFAVHGPFAALAVPLFLGGGISNVLVGLGLDRPMAFIAAFPIFGLIAGLAIWLVGMVPSVREARIAAKPGVVRANNQNSLKWGRAFGIVPREPKV